MELNAPVEIGQFRLNWRFNVRRNRHELVVKSTGGGGHSAVHSTYHLLSEDGEVIATNPLDENSINFIAKNFASRGDTESFEIYEKDLLAGKFDPNRRLQILPEDVRHSLTKSENEYTATGEKLNYHWPIFAKLRETGYSSIIRATMTFHQVCSSRCHYCSTIARNKADSISLEEAKTFVEELHERQVEFNRNNFSKYNEMYKDATGFDIGLRGLIFSGGGQPNLWPHFEEFVDWVSKKEIDLGLITNGFPKKISEDVYKAFKWIRISITPEDASPHYLGGKFDNQYIPSSIIDSDITTVGYSYVYGPWTEDDILIRIRNSIDKYGFHYCRTLTDCNLSRRAQLQAHKNLSDRLLRLGLIDVNGFPTGKIFHQLKYHGTQEEADQIWSEGQCYLQSYNVFWDTTGHDDNKHSFCYPCDSVTVLTEDDMELKVSERKFNGTKWGTVTNDQVGTLYTMPLKAFFDPRSICNSCLFMKNNLKVKELRDNNLAPKVSGTSFEHVNFP
jgi:organic radical activating enzyme